MTNYFKSVLKYFVIDYFSGLGSVLLTIREEFKKSDFYHLGGGGGQQGPIITFYFLFFVPNVLKIISRHKRFFKYRGRGAAGALEGTLSPPFGPWQTLSVLQLT